MKKIYRFSLMVLVATAFWSCAQTEFEVIPSEKLMGDSLVANYTISQLIDSFMTDSDKFTEVKYGKVNAGLFTSDKISSTDDVIIKGVITSSDMDGNVYKYIIVQEENGGRAIKISIDAAGLSAPYPLGLRVWVRCNGLYLGKYAQSPQIGTLYYNPTKSVLNTQDSSVVYRKEPGRIPLPVAAKAIHTYGMPDTTLIKPDTMTIAEIKAAGAAIFNKLVCIKNAFFTGMGADYGLPVALSASELIFAPSTNGVGYPQSREIQDGTGSIFIATSEYAKFASTKLPDSSNRGNITAIVGWYNDKKPDITPSSATSTIYHQLTIRSLKDLGKGFEKFHAENK